MTLGVTTASEGSREQPSKTRVEHAGNAMADTSFRKRPRMSHRCVKLGATTHSHKEAFHDTESEQHST